MKKILFIIISILAIIMLVTGCSAEKADNAIKVAALVPLTGDYALYGIDEAAIARSFIEEWNKEHDIKLKLLVEDTESAPRVALTALQRLLIQEPDVIIITPAPSAMAIQATINQNRILTFAVDVAPELASGYMIQNWPTNEIYAKHLVAELEKNDHKRLGLVYRNDELGVAVKDSILQSFKGTVFVEAADPNEKDYRSQITKIKSKNTDAVFIINGGKNLGIAVKQIRDLMGEIPIYSGPEISYPDVKEAAGPAYRGISYVDFDFNYTQPKLKELREKYVEKFNREPSPDTIVGTNALLLFTSCIPFESKEQLLECVKNNEVEGVAGKIKVKDNSIDYSEIITVKRI